MENGELQMLIDQATDPGATALDVATSKRICALLNQNPDQYPLFIITIL